MSNFQNIVESRFIECKIDVVYINRSIGNTIHNLDLKYLTLTEIIKDAKLYSSSNTFHKNDTHTGTF